MVANVIKGGGLQNLHADNPDNPDPTSIANTLWLLDDFTPHNSATRLVPGVINARFQSPLSCRTVGAVIPKKLS